MNWLKGFAAVLIFFMEYTALAEEYRLKFVPDPKHVNLDFKWDEGKDTMEPRLQIRASEKEGSLYFVKLEGRYSRKNKNILYANQPVELGGDGKFTIEVDMDSTQHEVIINIVDEAGEVTPQKGELFFPDWEKFITSQKESPPKKWSVSPGLGLTLANYQQTGVSSFTETALTLKVAGTYAIDGPWDVGASAYYTILPLSTSQSGVTIQFLGLNLRTGFRVLKPGQTWGLSIMGGYYYATSFASQGFGYHNLQGPQIYPVVTKRFSGRQSAGAYLKISPILKGFTFVSLASAEFALGGG